MVHSPERLLSYTDVRVVAAVEMILERGHRRVGIASLDRVDDALVLLDDLLQRLGRPPGTERRHADEAAELTQERAQDRQLGALGDPQVEPLVEVEELLVQALPGGTALLHQIEPEPV